MGDKIVVLSGTMISFQRIDTICSNKKKAGTRELGLNGRGNFIVQFLITNLMIVVNGNVLDFTKYGNCEAILS